MKNIKLALTIDGFVFIGDLDEEKKILKEAFKMIHQVMDGGKKFTYGMVDPFMPYSVKENKAIETLDVSEFIAFRDPRLEIVNAYTQLTSGIVLPTNAAGGKIVSAHAGEVISFSDRKGK